MTQTDIQKLILSRVVSVSTETKPADKTGLDPQRPNGRGESFTPHGYTPHGLQGPQNRNPAQPTPEPLKTQQRANTAGLLGKRERTREGTQVPMMKEGKRPLLKSTPTAGNCWVNEAGTLRIEVLHGEGFGFYPWVRTVSGSLWVTNAKGLTVPFATPIEAIEAGLSRARER